VDITLTTVNILIFSRQF